MYGSTLYTFGVRPMSRTGLGPVVPGVGFRNFTTTTTAVLPVLPHNTKEKHSLSGFFGDSQTKTPVLATAVMHVYKTEQIGPPCVCLIPVGM